MLLDLSNLSCVILSIMLINIVLYQHSIPLNMLQYKFTKIKIMFFFCKLSSYKVSKLYQSSWKIKFGFKYVVIFMISSVESYRSKRMEFSVTSAEQHTWSLSHDGTMRTKGEKREEYNCDGSGEKQRGSKREEKKSEGKQRGNKEVLEKGL